MKKFAIILTVAAGLLMYTGSFATEVIDPGKVTSLIKKAFQQEFSDAESVKWRRVEDFYFATFKMNNTNIEVAYTEEGALIAISREMDISQLPLSVSMALDEKYEGYALSNNVLEIFHEGQTYYYVHANSHKKFLKLKCDSSGGISVEKKIKKKLA